MPHAGVAIAPDVSNILLARGAIVAVIHIKNRVVAFINVRQFDPRHQSAGRTAKRFYFMRELGFFIGAGKQNIIAVILSASRQIIIRNQIDQHREIG